LNSSGVPSIRITRQRFVIGTVVIKTRIAKMYVQMGSQYQALGSKYMIMAAIITPID
jgi:hypothetical protein